MAEPRGVEVQNCYQGYDSSWNWTTKTNKATLSKRCYERLVREAREHFDGFGIDFTQYGRPTVVLSDEITAQVEWVHRLSGKSITLLEIWFNKKTGAINQCGQNYGGLVS